jgi:hypothetical protein
MSGISPQQKEGSSKKRRNRKEKGARIEKKKVEPHLKSSMFQKEKKRKRKRDLQAAGRDSIEIN